ncbi:hypothetical protein QTP86_021665 [Hemibagrus guttatus]|nr:hypothetical protein QTP86_021665 [Hemibagrus guttatus]
MKGQIVMARPLDQNISKTAALVGCSRSAVVSIYQKCYKEGTVVNRRQGQGSLMHVGSECWPMWSDPTDEVLLLKFAEEVNAGSDRKGSEYTVHHSLLCMGPHSRRAVRAPMLTPVHHRKHQQWTSEHQNWTMEQWKNVAWSDESRFLLHHVDGRMCVPLLPGEHLAPGCIMGRRRAGGGSVLLRSMFRWETLGPAVHVDVTVTRSNYLNIVTDHVHPFMETLFPDGCGLFQQDNAPCHKAEMLQEWFDEHNNRFEVLTPPPNSPDLNPIQHLWDVLDKLVPSMEARTSQLTGLKGSAANILVSDTTAHLQGSSGVHASTSQAGGHNTTEEVSAKLNGLRVENFSSEDVNENFTFLSDYPVPSSVNWTEDGFVTPVQSQFTAFSVVGALEAQMKKRKGEIVPLSVQNLVDCSSEEGNHGCTRGCITNAFNYIINQDGISKDADYPYEQTVGYCRPSPKYGRCSGFRFLQRYNEFELQKVVANIGPVAVGINASHSTFHHYQPGKPQT